MKGGRANSALVSVRVPCTLGEDFVVAVEREDSRWEPPVGDVFQILGKGI